MKKDVEGFPARLKSLIGEASVSAFARHVGLSESVIRSYLAGGKLPGLRHALSIAEAKGVTLDWLATGITNRNSSPSSCDSGHIFDSIAEARNHYTTTDLENRNSCDSSGVKVAIPENESQPFHERLREVVGLEKSLSFAKRCGFSDSLLGAYLRGEKKPGFDNLVTIARVTGVTIDWLATGREPKFRRDVVAAASAEPAPDQASGEPVDLVAIYKDAPPEGRRALAALAVAIRDRTFRAWLAAGQAIAEAAQIFDRTK